MEVRGRSGLAWVPLGSGCWYRFRKEEGRSSGAVIFIAWSGGEGRYDPASLSRVT
ncbi:hypothetical protein ASZ90_015697 [hydrocarbon metagenome]|uniref:Uncharacterized protein n=1 Tax=hydrocarbon metagenome TaxID=938273 RepID=A0A0W8F1E8_9ZZZZ